MVKRNPWFLIILTIVLVGLLVFGGCTPSTDPEGGKEEEGDEPEGEALTSINVVTAKPGGAYYPLAVGLSEIFEASTGIGTSVEASTGGSMQNVQVVGQGMADLSLASGFDVYEAYMGIGYHEGKGVPDLRVAGWLSSHYTASNIVVLASSPIKTWDDISGFKINANVPGGFPDVILRRISKLMGWTPVVENQTNEDGINALKDGLMDGVYHSGGLPIPSFVDLALTHDVRILPMTDETATKIVENIAGFNKFTMPAGTYKGQTEPVLTIASDGIVIVNKRLPDDVVYKFVKGFYAMEDRMMSAHATGGPNDPEDMLKSPIPLHPGAIKYLEEIGIDVPGDLRP